MSNHSINCNCSYGSMIDLLCIAAAIVDARTGLIIKTNEKFRQLVVEHPPPGQAVSAESAEEENGKNETETERTEAETDSETTTHPEMLVDSDTTDALNGKDIWDLLELDRGFTSGDLTKRIYQGQNSPDRWVKCHMTKIPPSEGSTDDDGHSRYLVQLEDVHKIINAKEQWTAVLETSFDGFFDWHITKDYEYMSPRFWEMFGYEPSEKLHKPSEWMGIVNKDDLKSTLENYNKHVETRGAFPFNQEVRYEHKKGHYVYVSCRGKVIDWAEDGSPLRMVGTHTDITEKKQTEATERHLYQKIAQEHRRVVAVNEELRKFVQHVNGPVFGTDADGVINTWNNRMENITGVKRESVIGKALADSPVRNAKEMVEEALKGEEVTSALLDIVLSKEITLKLLVNTTTRRSTETNILGCYCFGLDLTEIESAKDEMLQVRERYAAEKKLNEFVAHEIRNPLAAAMSAAQFIKDELVINNGERLDQGDTRCAALQADSGIVCGSLDYIHQLLKSMIDLNEFSRNGVILKAKNAYLKRDILDPVYAMYSYQMDSKVKLLFEYSKEQWIHVDIPRLQQIIINLVSNSVKFTKEGFIKIKIGRPYNDHETLCISVEDSGPGIPVKKKALLFERYVELAKQVQGSGLGLNVTKLLVEAMGGTIDVDWDYSSGVADFPGTRMVVNLPLPELMNDGIHTDTNGVESIFAEAADQNSSDKKRQQSPLYVAAPDGIASRKVVRTPMATPQEEKIAKQSISEKRMGLQNLKRILIVDDDRIIRKLLSRRFTNLDKALQIDTAESGEQAIELIVDGKTQYDLVIMDHFMPLCGGVLTGEETIARIRPFVDGIIAGSSGNDMCKEHTAAGADLFWLKPVPKDAILLGDLAEAHCARKLGMTRFKS